MMKLFAKYAAILLIAFVFVFSGYHYRSIEVDLGNGNIFENIKKFFNDTKVFVEVIYFVVASLLIPIAYVQYRNERKREKKGAVEYAHKLFRIYTEDILLKEKRFNQQYLKELSLQSDKEEINEFNNMLNRLDAFAAAFIHGIADLDAGKRMMGNTFCDQINSYLPTIIRISGNNYKKELDNLFELYEKWKNSDGSSN